MITSRLKQNGILLKMIVLICGLIAMFMLVKPASATSNENYDPSKATTCTTPFPFWTTDPYYDSANNRIYARMATSISYGTTINGCGMGHGSSHSHWYSGYAILYVNGKKVGGEGETGSNYKVYASGTAVSQGASDYVEVAFNASDYLTAGKPSITSSGFTKTGSTKGEVYASATGSSSSVTWQLDLWVTDWYGPGDNSVRELLGGDTGVVATGSGTISVTDEVVSYDYYFSKSGRSGSGTGSSFSHSANIEEAGGYCKVTFYSKGGKSVTEYIDISDAATLTYDGNGNGDTVTNVPSSVTAWEGYYITISSLIPRRANYDFLGWNTSSSYAEMPYNTTSAPYNTYTGGDEYRLSGDRTLYAVWRQVKVPYNLKFTLNGQSISNDYVYVTGYVNNSCRVSNGWAFSALEIPGYSIRYTATPTNSNAVYIISGSSNSRTVSSDTYDTVTCGTIHTITYSANGGTYGTDEAGNELAGPEDQTRYYGKSLYLTSTVPTRVGYTFAGWKSNRTGITFSAGGLYGTGSTAYSSWMRGGTETMVAQWKPITYTVKFDRNTPPGATSEVTGTMNNITCTYDVAQNLPANTFKLTGCDFQGWNTEPDGSGISYKDKESIKNLTATQGQVITLYAQWKVTYQVVGSLNGVTSTNFCDANGVSFGEIITSTGKMVRTNAVNKYKDGDTDGDGKLTADDAKLIRDYLAGNATPASDAQKVAMDVNGDGEITEDDAAQVTRLISELTLTSSKNLVFTLLPEKFLCYDYPGYTATVSVQITADDVYIYGINNEVYDGTDTTRVDIPEKTINSTYTDTIRFGTIHTISFAPNDSTTGNGSTQSSPMPDDITKYYGIDETVPAAPERDGYNFTGWKSDANDQVYQPGDTYTYAQRGGTDTLVAQWEPITYTVTFDKNQPADATYDVLRYVDGELRNGNMEDLPATFDDEQNLPKNEYKLAGWVFVGWNTKPDGTGTSFADEAEFVNLTIVDKSVVTLYAQWKNIDSVENNDDVIHNPDGDPDKVPTGGEPDQPYVNPDGTPNYHGLSVTLNNNGLLYGLDEENTKLTRKQDGSLFKADDPSYTYMYVTDADFKTIKTASTDKTRTIVYKDDADLFSYYSVNAGDSYIEVTQTGEKVVHKFVGWSVYKYATLSQSPDIIHAEAEIDNMLNLIYEYQAVCELGYNDVAYPGTSQLYQKAADVLTLAGNELAAADAIKDRDIVLYAIWDAYPLITVKDVSILSSELKTVPDEDAFEETIKKRIEESIVTDREDGDWDKGVNPDIEVSIDKVSLTNAYEYLKELETKYGDLSSTGSASINIIVTDKTGNQTTQIINVWLIASNPLIKDVTPSNTGSDTDDGSGDGSGDGSTGEGTVSASLFMDVTSYVRAISREFYEKAEEDGGLMEYSLWKTNDEYKDELIATFDILDNDEGWYQVWVFNADEVKEVQQYIADNGLGNSESTDALAGFLEKFGDCRVKG